MEEIVKNDKIYKNIKTGLYKSFPYKVDLDIIKSTKFDDYTFLIFYPYEDYKREDYIRVNYNEELKLTRKQKLEKLWKKN